MKKKACKLCKSLTEGDECPICKSKKFATTWQGRIIILDEQKSDIAKKVNMTKKGEYAIKVR